MYKVKIKFSKKELGIEESFETEKNFHKRTFDAVLSNLVDTVHAKGVGGADSRSFFRILTAMDNAEGDFLELAENDYLFLKGIFNHELAKVTSQLIRIYSLQRQAIDDAEQ